jgi:hypothetical protein
VEPILILSWLNKSVECCFYTSCYFHDGDGVGLLILLEYRPATSMGVIYKTGYDSRKGSFDQVLTACDCPADLKQI